MPGTQGLDSFVDLIERRAAKNGDALVYRFLTDGEVGGRREELTFAGLARRARAIAAHLRAEGAEGKRVLLLYPPGLGFVEGFLGCLYAGCIAVPAYPPDPSRLERSLTRLRAIVLDCTPSVILTTTALAALAKPFLAGEPAFRGHRWIASDALPDVDEASTQAPDKGSVAFLQYTSGSTGSPRGVMVTHANLLHHASLIEERLGPDTRGALWLPPYHDMGLILGIVQPIYGGWPITLLSPLDFLKRPLRWLEAIADFGATATGAPDFAYELCVRRATEADKATLDLRSLQVACSGAEPVRAATMRAFAEAFEPCGFSFDAFDPCYGLAETTLVVTGTRPRSPTLRAFGRADLAAGRAAEAHGVEAAAELVGCGRPFASQPLHIVDPESLTAHPEGRIGEIWVAGDSVAAGYWGRPEETEESFGAHLASGDGPFLRTGDLGFLSGGELYITGRIKDLIVVRGQNHYPQDLETAATQSHPALRPGSVVAFGFERGGHERVAVIAEVDRAWKKILFHDATAPAGLPSTFDGVRDAVRAAIASQHEITISALCLLPPGSVPKTSSGKLQRRACREQWESGKLPALAEWSEDTDAVPTYAEPIYDDVVSRLAQLDRRSTRYQFDLERDICWDRIDEPGKYLGDGFLRARGIEPTRFTPEEAGFFHTLAAILHADRFVLLEEHLLRFTQGQHAAMGPTRSLLLLEEEEEKHIALFRRYAAHLRARWPELADHCDARRDDFAAFLERFGAAERYPTVGALHYALWLGILFFEEYTVYVYEQLAEDGGGIQPTWLAAHKAHRREEVQHVLTDYAYIQALHLTEEERYEWSKRLFDDLTSGLLFLGPGDDLALCEERFPGLRQRVHSAEGGQHLIAAILRSSTFTRTRAAGPYFAFVADRPIRPSLAAPEAIEAERLWVRGWLANQLRQPADSIDVRRTFTEYGLDSVSLIELSGELEKRLDRRLPATLPYDFPTVERLAEHLASLPTDAPPLPPPQIRPGPLAVSARQDRLVRLAREQEVLDHITHVYLLDDSTPRDALTAALAALVARHEPLRASFRGGDSERQVEQHVAEAVVVPLRDVVVEGEWLDGIRRVAAAQDARPFDLETPPLWRATLLRPARGADRALVLTLHHGITDGWSMEILWRELLLLVRQAQGEETVALPPLSLQQADTAARERAFEATDEHRSRIAWWRDRLNGHPWLTRPAAALPLRCGALTRAVDPAVFEAVQSAARRSGVSLYMALLTSFHLAVMETTGVDDVLVNTHLFDRFTAEERSTMGYFVNLLTLRAELHAGIPFAEALQRVRIAWMEALENKVSIDRLVEELVPGRYGERFMPAPVAFNLLPAESEPDGAAGLVRDNTLAPPPSFLFFEKMLLASTTKGRLSFTLWYDPGATSDEEAERFMGCLCRWVATAHRAGPREIADPSEVLDGVEVAAPEPATTASAARADAAIRWLREYAEENINSRLIDERRSIPPSIVLDFASHGLFGLQTPRAIGGLDLTHRDAMRLVEQLAAVDLTLATLVGTHNDLGVQPILHYGTDAVKDDLLPRLASGRELAAFALTEPGAGSNVLGIATKALGEGGGRARLHGTKLWSGTAAWAGAITVYARHIAADGHELGVSAFVVRRGAKGLRMGPEALTMGLRGMVQGIFHMSGVEVGPEALLGEPGQGLAIAQEAMSLGRMGIAAMSIGAMKRCAQLFHRYASRRRIGTGLHLDNPVTALRLGELTLRIRATEALLEACVGPMDAGADVPFEVLSVAKIVGSESLWQSADALVQALGGRGFIETNEAPQLLRDARVMRIGEGPTEALQMHLGAALLTPGSPLVRHVGERFGAELASALDELGAALQARAGQLFGDPVRSKRYAAARLGELATDAITWGALRLAPRDLLTARAEAWAEQRFVEARARASALTTEAALVSPRATLDALIEGYADAIGDLERLAPDEDRERDPLLRRQAPESAPAEAASEPPADAAMVTFLRDRLAALLRTTPAAVPTDRPLSEIGLDSVVAVELAHAVETHLGRPVDPSLAWSYPTIEAMARHLAAGVATTGGRLAVVPTPPAALGPLSFMERQLFALLARSPAQEPYNLFVPLRHHGPMDPPTLERCFSALLRRHENLRAAYVLHEGEPRRRIVEDVEWALEVVDLRALTVAERTRAVRAACDELRHLRLDLERPPLLRTRLLLLAPEESVLLTVVNHLAVDAWSLGILFGELGATYAAAMRGSELPLPPLPLRYADYAVAVDAALAEVMARGDAFPPWPDDGFRLPLDSPRPPEPKPLGARTAFALEPERHVELLALCREHAVSPAMAVIVAWQVALHRHTARRDVAFTLVQGNRRVAGLGGVVGLFVYGETIRGELPGAPDEPTWTGLLSRARRLSQQESPFASQLYNYAVQPPSIRVSLNFHNFDAATGADAAVFVPALDLNPYAYVWETHDILLNVVPVPKTLVFDTLYRSEVLRPETIARLMGELRRAIHEMVASPEQTVSLEPAR